MKLVTPQKHLGPVSFFLCVLLIYLAGIISVDMYVPALPSMQKEFDVTASFLNLTMFTFFVMQAVGVLVSGPISDRLGRRLTLVLCNVIFLAGSLGCMVSPSVEVLVAFRMVEAFAFGGIVSLSTALVQDAYQGEDLRRAQSALQSLILVGPAIAPFLGSLMLMLFDWRAIFAFVSAGGLLATLASLLISETTASGLQKRQGGGPQRTRLRNDLRDLVKNRFFASLSLFMGVAGVPWFAFIAVVSYVVMDFFGAGYLEYSVLYAVVAMVGVVSPFVYLRLAKRFRVRQISLIAMLLVLATLVLVVFGGKVSPVLFAAAFLPYVLAEGIVRPMSYVALLDQPAHRVGLASSLVNFCYSVITAFATVAATLPWGNYVDGLAWIVGATLAFMLILYLMCFGGRNRT